MPPSVPSRVIAPPATLASSSTSVGAKRPESDVWEFAQCLYDSTATGNQADAMTELTSRAQTSDPDAIDLLLNLAAGSDDIAKLAQEALLTLYGSPQTSEALREVLREASYTLFESVSKANVHVKQKPSGVPGTSASSADSHSVSLAVAYLGGQYAHACNYSAMEAEIETHISEKLSGVLSAEDGGRLLASNREVTHAELAGQKFGNLAMHNTPLDINNSVGLKHALEYIALLTSFSALKDKPPIIAAWLHAEGHWLPAVFEWKEGSLHCTVLDSLADRPSAAACKQQLWDLSQQHQITPHMISANMQKNAPNACGVLGTRLFMQIDRNLAAGGSKQPIAEQIQSYVQAWNGLDKDQQSAVILAERAALLTGLAEVNQSIAPQ